MGKLNAGLAAYIANKRSGKVAPSKGKMPMDVAKFHAMRGKAAPKK